MKTMGELWDKLKVLLDNTPAEYWMKQWAGLCDENSMATWRAFPTDQLQVEYFVEDLNSYFREEMSHIGSESLYSETLRSGRAAMNIIRDTANEISPGFGDIANTPATPTEMIMMTQGQV